MRIETDVLVIGGGPTGDVIAGELGRRGVNVVLVDETDGIFREGRLHNVSARTMELARIFGIEQDIVQCGWPLDHPLDIAFMTSVTGHEIARIPWQPIADTVAGHESPCITMRCPQSWFNPILHKWVASLPNVEVKWKHRLEAFTQDDAGVTAQVTDMQSGSQFEIHAQYMIGADGAHSTVQRLAGITRQGSETHGYAAEMLVRSPEFAALVKGKEAGRFIFTRGDDGISLTINPFDGKEVFRLTLMAHPTEPTEADLIAGLEKAAGRPVAYEPVTELAPWRNRDTIVDSFRAGRVYLVGDAAHTWPPTGGYLANTGVLDSFDLGWKLAAVIQGWGGETLLDSYEPERRAHATRMRKIAVSILQDWFAAGAMVQGRDDMLLGGSAEAVAWREELGNTLTTTLRREFNSYAGTLGYRYEQSPIIVRDGTPEPPDPEYHYAPVARPGHLTPHAWLPDGSAILDHFGAGFVLFDAGAPSTLVESYINAASARGIPFEVVQDTSLVDLFESRLVLSRPDGHVAWRWQGEEVDADRVMGIVSGAVIGARSSLVN